MALKTVEETFAVILDHAKQGPVSVRTLLRLLSGRGKRLILIFLSLPFCLPIQIPGLSTPFGLAILLVSLRFGLGTKIWAPKALLNKKIPSASLKKGITKGSKLLKKLRLFSRPR